MNVLDVHERANEAIRSLSAALAERTAATDDPDDAVEVRPKRIRTLPDVDYGTVEGCDRALREVRDRLDQIRDLTDGPEIADAREEALSACRELVDVVGTHRGQLATVDDDDDDD